MNLNGNESVGSIPDAKRSELRATMAAVERAVARIRSQNQPSGDVAAATESLLSSLDELVRQLALGTEPEYRQCPVCNHIGMRAASVCGYCWTRLPPLAGPGGAGS